MASTSKAPPHRIFTYTDPGDIPDQSQALLSWIQSLHASLTDPDQADQPCTINLESVSTARSAYKNWPEMCNELAKYLVRPNLRQIIVPTALSNMIVGKCGHALRTTLLGTLPPSVSLFEQNIDVKSLVNVSLYTDKITCNKGTTQELQNTVVDFLNNLVNNADGNDPLQVSLQLAIVRAYKFTRKLLKCKPFKNPKNGKALNLDDLKKAADPLPTIGSKTLKCYVCKKRFLKRRRKTPVVKQYPRLCGPCAETNYAKRNARVDLSGKYAVVTGGRIKIGLEIVLKLLRDGCNVIMTSRFPRNAAREYSQQPDYSEWKHRLKIYPLDLKDIAGIYAFISYVKSTFPHLDILINNAAQTLRRPMDFYRSLLDLEQIPHNHIPPLQQTVLASTASLDYGLGKSLSMNAPSHPAIAPQPSQTCKIEEVDDEDDDDFTTGATKRPLIDDDPKSNEEPLKKMPKLENIGSDHDADKPGSVPELKRMNSDPCSSKLEDGILKRTNSVPCPSKEEDDTRTLSQKPGFKRHQSLGPLCAVASPQIRDGSATSTAANPFSFSLSRFFPRGLYDDDGQQLDLRRTNTWRTVLQSVSLGEFMEVFVINTVAPFILNKELKSHLRQKGKHKKSDAETGDRKFIVNVSAMEGQFNRRGKNKFHPHTNMAKAALNMMTRTAALEYKESDIYMTSVDTGWVSDERPFHLAKREESKGFRLPLDCVDGAARVLDPIITGYTNSETPHFAVFLKDYNVYPW